MKRKQSMCWYCHIMACTVCSARYCHTMACTVFIARYPNSHYESTTLAADVLAGFHEVARATCGAPSSRGQEGCIHTVTSNTKTVQICSPKVIYARHVGYNLQEYERRIGSKMRVNSGKGKV